MKPGGQIQYASCDDKQLMDMIAALPHNDEDAVYVASSLYGSNR